MDLTNTFFLIQSIAISIFLILAVYVALIRSARRINLPFILMTIIQAFNAYSFFLIRSPSGEETSVPLLLRFKVTLIAFLPGIFIHMFLPLFRGNFHRRVLQITQGTYLLGAITACATFIDDFLIQGIIPRGVEGANLLDPLFHSIGLIIVLAWATLSIVATTTLILRAVRDDSEPRVQVDAALLLFPWSLFIIAGIVRTMGHLLPVDALPGLSLFLSSLGQLLTIVATILLARVILRFGSPVGRKVYHRVLPILITLATAVIAYFILVYNLDLLTSPLQPLVLVLISLISGVALARPEWPQRIAHWLGPTPPDDIDFAIHLHRSWESLAEGSYNVAQVAEMILALQEQIQADYAGVLELVEIDENKQLTFGRWEDGPRLLLNAEPYDWPLTEKDLQNINLKTSGIPGPPKLILPIHDEQNLAGILLIGERIRGGEYSTGDLRIAELLVSQLSFALAHGLRLEEAVGMPRRLETQSVILPEVNIAIRTFGRLDIYNQYGDTSTPRPSLRARQILAMLLAAYPDPVPAETLMERLWPEHPQEDAANSLYVAIYALRRALEPNLQKGAISKYIHRERDCYQLILDDEIWVDYLEFERLYSLGKDFIANDNHQGATQVFERAIRICRRPFLADATLDLPVEVEMTRHRLQRYLHEMAWFIAQRCSDEQNWPQAERALLHLLAVDHHDLAARKELARIYRQQGKESLAQELETSLKLDEET